jgi:hypothetical protein
MIVIAVLDKQRQLDELRQELVEARHLADEALLQVDMLEAEIADLESALDAGPQKAREDLQPAEYQGEFDFSAR